jgi:hypothetical protein
MTFLLTSHKEINKLFTFPFLGLDGRTFGFRGRMIRKILLPLAFIGGFLTAIIIGIKITGAINMLLIAKVLLLQLGLVLGKIIYGLKDLIYSKHDASPATIYPVYISPPHQSSHDMSHSSHSSLSSGYGNSRIDPYSHQSNYQAQPSYHQPIYQFPQQNLQPQTNFVQPQNGPFLGIPLQAPQAIERNQFLPQYSQQFDAVSDDEAPKATLSPQEMTQILSDAIEQVSSRRGKPSSTLSKDHRTDFAP